MNTVKPQKAISLANSLRPLLLHLGRELRRQIPGLGISSGQIELLSLINNCPDTSANALALKMGITPPSMSNALDKLVDSKLITRTKNQETDHRIVSLSLTSRGHDLLSTAKTMRTSWLVERLQNMTSEQIFTLEAALEPLDKLTGKDSSV